MEYTQYKFNYMIPEVLRVAQEELREFLETNEPTDFADLTWFEKQYGHELNAREIMKTWYAIPNLRAGLETEWSNALPKTTHIAKELPGIVNFSMNAIMPGGAAPVHSDYSYDMRFDLAKTDKVYVILMGVSVPENCGFKLGDTEIQLNTGDIIAFDGGIPHGSYNNSDSWRYTINMDIKAEYWT